MTREEIEYTNKTIPEMIIKHAFINAQGNPLFVSWLSDHNGELVIRTFGYRKLTRGELEITEVMRTSPEFKGAVVKNIYYTGMAGYRVVFRCQNVMSKSYSYWGYGASYFRSEDFDKWQYIDKPYGFTTSILNQEDLFKIPKYKYCGFSEGDLIEYLRAYNVNPEIEYIGKLGLVYHKRIIDKVKKDRRFVGFLKANVKAINSYGPAASIYAYEHNIGIAEAQNILWERAMKQRDVSRYAPTCKILGLNSIKVYDYCEENHIGLTVYNDYLFALDKIGGFDMTDTKNAFPKEFMRMHDLRIQQWNGIKARLDKEAKKKLEREFIEQAKKAAEFVYSDGVYCIVIPGKISDLVREGKVLHHCVGEMGYDAKMAKGETLIVFVRKASNPTVPYVTVEWKENKVRQCYAYHDSKPDDETRAFVDKWASWMKQKVA